MTDRVVYPETRAHRPRDGYRLADAHLGDQLSVPGLKSAIAMLYEAMDELLEPLFVEDKAVKFNFRSISVMGKAGILPGKKGDIMLATAHVFEGTSDNYRIDNDLSPADFSDMEKVFVGPMVTVLGTSLQNRDMLEKFQSDWKVIGLEMEGGHFQRAISAAIIKRPAGIPAAKSRPMET